MKTQKQLRKLAERCCALVNSCPPSDPNRDDIVAAVGVDHSFETLPEVARFFGIAPSTAKGWRANLMPGKPGSYPLTDIVEWLCKLRIRNNDRSRKFTTEV